MKQDKLGEHFVNDRALMIKVFSLSGYFPDGDELERQILGHTVSAL